MFRLLLKLSYGYTFCCKLASSFFRASISASLAALSAVNLSLSVVKVSIFSTDTVPEALRPFVPDNVV